MSYTQYTFYQKLIVPVLLVLFLLLSVVGYGQNDQGCPGCNDCTNTVDSIVSKLDIPDTVCAGSTNIYTIGYDTTKDIVIVSLEPRIDSAERMFIPDGLPCGEDNSCVYSSPITFSGFKDTIHSANDIKYVRLNIEHSRAAELNIRLKCPSPNNTTVNILFPDIDDFPESNICFQESDFQGWIGWNDFTTLYDWNNAELGDANESSIYSCDSNSYGNEYGTGWNYCWSSNNSFLTEANYAFDDGRIYRELENGYGVLQNNLLELENNRYSFIPSNIVELTHFYHPDENFQLFDGCPINGTWTIEIIDLYEDDHNGYLFDWEIVFDESVLTPAGNSVNSAAVLTTGGQADTNFVVTFGTSDSTIIFHAPIVTHDTTITDTLRLFDPVTHCWYDTVFTVVVMAPTGEKKHVEICAGGSITLEANCDNGNSNFSENFDEINTGGDTWHSNSHTIDGHTYHGPGRKPIDSIPEYLSALSGFQTFSKVYPAGGKVKLGMGDTIGSMTSVPLNLTNPFSVQIRAKGWGSEPTSTNPPKKTKMNVVVDIGMDTQQERSFETDPAYHWPGTEAYRNY